MVSRGPTGPGRTQSRPVRRTYRSAGLRIGYIDWSGQSPSQMLLIHDLGDSPRTWDLLVPRFRGSHHVYAPELRGHGGADRPPAAEYGFDDLYSDISTFASKIGLEGAVAIGHGAGSRLAARLAADVPGAVSSLVICDLEAREDHAESEWASFDEMVGYLRRQRPGAADAVLDRQGRSLSGGGLDGGRSFKHDSAAYPAYMAPGDELWDDWSRISCPTLVLRGRLSRDLTHGGAVGIAECIGRRRLAEIEGAGRWLHHEMPCAFEETLRWFLDSPPH